MREVWIVCACTNTLDHHSLVLELYTYCSAHMHSLPQKMEVDGAGAMMQDDDALLVLLLMLLLCLLLKLL